MISVFLFGCNNIEMRTILQHIIMGFDYRNFIYCLSAGDFPLYEKNMAPQNSFFNDLFVADGRGQKEMVAMFGKVMSDPGRIPFLFVNLKHLNPIDCHQHDGKQGQAGIESIRYSGIETE